MSALMEQHEAWKAARARLIGAQVRENPRQQSSSRPETPEELINLLARRHRVPVEKMYGNGRRPHDVLRARQEVFLRLSRDFALGPTQIGQMLDVGKSTVAKSLHREDAQALEPAGEEVAAPQSRLRDWIFVNGKGWRGKSEKATPVAQSPFRAAQIIAQVAKKHGVSVRDITSARRDKLIVAARHEAAWELKRQTSLSLPQIGRKLGNRDHTTVLHALKRHQERMIAGQA